MTRVLIAADDSAESRIAAQAAHRLFGDTSEYWLVNVGQTVTSATGTWGMAYPIGMPMAIVPLELIEEDREAALEEAASHATEIAVDAEIDAHPVGAVGDPVTAIIDAAHERLADVIVVGSRERGWLDRLLHSSVSDSVVKNADIPVLVVK
ncbi:MAG: universal stress protein [Acidimicrobiia bacterium]